MLYHDFRNCLALYSGKFWYIGTNFRINGHKDFRRNFVFLFLYAHFAYFNKLYFSQPHYRRRAKGCSQESAGPGSGRSSEGWKCR